MLDVPIVASFGELLYHFGHCFTAPSFETFHAIMCGWVLNLGRHTVTGTVRAASAVGSKHISSFHRFFSQARWCRDELGLVLVRLVVERLPKDAPVIAVVDDTLGRHTGKRIAAASMHRDPLLSTAMKPLFHWGHLWVVLGITIRAFDKTWCLPVLVRLYRGKKLCKAERREYRTCQQLACEIIALLADTLPERQIVIVGDAEYTNQSVIKPRPSNVTVVGRCRLDAAIYAPPPPRPPGKTGRPRVRGDKLPSPQVQAADRKAKWEKVDVSVYRHRATVKILVIDALWYVVGGGEKFRLVVVRGFPGHERDDVFVSTDETLDPKTIIEFYALRWSLEVTFHEAKGKFGFEEPQNRAEKAVERTAPMALWSYTLVVLWYLVDGKRTRAAKQIKAMPWYEKKQPTFSDMLATLRRATWSERLFDPRGNDTTFRKRVAPFIDYLDACA